VLVTGDGLVERLTVCEAAEVEGRAPAILVKVGGKVVVAIETSISLAIKNARRSAG
jgi:hypothetical protein